VWGFNGSNRKKEREKRKGLSSTVLRNSTNYALIFRYVCRKQISKTRHFAVEYSNIKYPRNSGDIAYLSLHSAMNVKRLTQNTRPTYIAKNRSAQLAADNDEYRTAVSLACSSQSVATIGSHNISHINELYTQPVPPRNHQQPTPYASSQPFSLPGNICKTILHAAKNKGAGINVDTIDLFTTLVKSSIPTVKPDLHFIFDLIYQNKLPQCIKRYFLTSTYSVSTRTPTTQPQTPPPRHPNSNPTPHCKPRRPRDKLSSHIPPPPIQLCSRCTQRKQLSGKGNATID